MRALLVIDVQPTFCEDGELGVSGGNEVATKIAAFVDKYRTNYQLIVTSQDWHIDPGTHFSSEPDFIDTWPPHGIAGSANAELHPALVNVRADITVKKGHYSAAYSAFEGIADSGETRLSREQVEQAHLAGRTLAPLLREAGITAIDVVGIAESHCVAATALDARAAGWPVRCFSDLTVPVSEELGAAARKDMSAAGVTLCESRLAFG
ncbi:MAG: isochorismatase family protein [Bowdeniella nasicola]|nr:isochorismatase family protein [Bowdeniella nasicola]